MSEDVDEQVHESGEGLTAALTSGPDTPLIIVTGMSGAGRTTAANVLEDRGWYVVDNFPPQLIGELQDLRAQALLRSPDGPPPLAVVIDARTRWVTEQFSSFLEALRSLPQRPILIFLDATDEALVRRFESVRRPHPMQGTGRLLDAIQSERELIADLRSVADIVLDTSGLNVHQLTQKIGSLIQASVSNRIRIAVMSFGFKYGVPLDADFVADMRFLPNPFWVPELRALNGRDQAVSDHVLAQPGAGEFLDRFLAMFEPILAGYAAEGRRYITIAIGCTGGKHRSVAMAEALAARLDPERVSAFVVHRDLGRE